MLLSIQGHGLNISKRFETYVNNKAEKLDRYLPGVEDVRVEVTPQSAKEDAPKAIQLTVRRKRTLLRVEERNPDIYAGFDRALDNMYQRIARYKGKRLGNKRGGAPADAELEAAEALPIDVDDYADPKPVVKTKVFELAPLAVLSCGFLIWQLPDNTFVFYGVWYAIGMVDFFGYSRNNTVLVEKAIAELRA